jgi:ADP-ribosylglycohydrolase
MRVSPVSVVSDLEDTTLTLAEITANVSHNHPEGVKGAKAIAFCTWAAFNNWSKDAIRVGLRDHIRDYNIDRTPQQIIDSGYKFHVSCQESVPEAICCFLDAYSYEDTIRKAVLLRGDTDTQACMAGAIAAAYWGIPEDIAEEGKDRLPKDLHMILYKFSQKYNLYL